MRIVSGIRNISFWGIFFLLILVNLFDISFNSIFSNISNNYFYLYLILSIPVFIITVIINFIYSYICKLSIFDTIIIMLPTLAWTPYKGFDIRSLIKSIKSGHGIFYDIVTFIFNLILMIIWWFIVIYGFISIRNRISNSNLLLNVFITIGIIVVMNIITILIFKIGSKSWLGEYRFNKNQGTIGQRYYERHPEHMPAACKACGGPYPECRGSCNVFDE